MQYHSDGSLLHATPKIERRLSRRFKVVMLAVLALVMSASTVAAWQMRESGNPTDLELARAEVVMTYLTEHHANAPWFGSILGVIIKDNRLYVRMSEVYLDLPADMPNEKKARQVEQSYARQIYQVLWDWHWDVPELDFDYVIIQDSVGNYIDGGQG